MKPKVSVCIPAYNSSKFLADCLDSVLAQSFEDFEIILVDNHSADNTLEIAKSYA
ncbi:MAG: glycosyltransferase family 2 protein [Patescibacteria group bacterium]